MTRRRFMTSVLAAVAGWRFRFAFPEPPAPQWQAFFDPPQTNREHLRVRMQQARMEFEPFFKMRKTLIKQAVESMYRPSRSSPENT